eukprot:TRINITY_DN55876_c0_g1_i1.p1 TRINITY_DN55876_c0_g1~~TRINITY_DN55876_c0_g1_i1.p1  ORF type:complete len:329 (+),score=146.56 TRINITY_DN55876_c0_g1_i1:16-1002(+)
MMMMMSSNSTNALASEIGVTTLAAGNFTLAVGTQYQTMPDSTALLARNDGGAALRKRLDEDGYVLLRGVLDRESVLAARHVVAASLHEDWGITHVEDGVKGKEVDDAVIAEGKEGVLLTGYTAITHHEDVLAVLEGEQLATLFERHVFGGRRAATFNNKWVRVKGKDEFTDEHTDFYRFSGNAEGMYTCWCPLGDYAPTHGTLVVCEGSHKLDGYTADDYSMEEKAELPPGFDKFVERPTTVWRSATFAAGDIVIFDIRLVHASTLNTTDRFRISMDTRWQPAEYVPKESKEFFTTVPATISASAAATTAAAAADDATATTSGGRSSE